MAHYRHLLSWSVDQGTRGEARAVSWSANVYVHLQFADQNKSEVFQPGKCESRTHTGGSIVVREATLTI